MKRIVWVLAALVSLAVLAVLAFQGPDRRQSLVEHQAEGKMKHLATDSVTSVRASSSAGTHYFKRAADGQWLLSRPAADAGVSAATGAAIEAGLRLLHNTLPERNFETEIPEFGLSAPVLELALQTVDGQSFEATFGATNPMGIAQYVRIRCGGQTTVHLMPTYVAQAWAPTLGGVAK
ncbi:hypothetical protein [Rhodoferax sp.]|uniref:hypothetical protein n=1 Tax=Rhodoferax sp. TaxID=50421 RepID=UPI002628AC5E|nr:hypothetical protein [Rhodoferax sp.]MDD2919127.1 hypothetical protein [Rhodoferax sp.]